MRFILYPVFFQWLSTAYVGLVSLTLSVLIARELGPTGFGEYGIALSVGAILAIFLDGGMRSILLREGTRTSKKLEHLSTQLPEIALGHLILVAALAIFIGALFLFNHFYLIIATVVCYLGIVLANIFTAMFRAEGRWGSDALWQVGHRTFSAVFIVAGIFVFGFNSSWQVLALWGTPLILLSFLFLYLRNIRPEFGVKLIVYRIAMPLALIDLATTIYFRSDVLVLNYFDIPKQDIGNYVAAYRFFEAVIMAITPVSLLFFRRMRLLDPGAANKFKKIALSVMVAAGVGFCIAVVTHYFSESIVNFTYGDGYYHSAGYLAVLGWSLVLVLPNALLTQALLALELDRLYLISAVIAAVANVLLNFWLVPVLGVEAVPYTTLATEAILFVCLGGFVITRVLLTITEHRN